MKKENKEFYLGLDIGTDSVGYAVTDTNYNLMKHSGEPMWGATLFEAASDAADRRMHRTARRRLDRRQERVHLVSELFASEISKKDPSFFKRLQASSLYRDEAGTPYTLFNDKDYTDKDYYKQYPTIHHLIVDLMKNGEPHDVRLVYLACIWLVAHRGHFLFDTPVENVDELLDFSKVYGEFTDWLKESEWALPWSENVTAEQIADVMTQRLGITKKTDLFQQNILNGKKLSKEVTEEQPFCQEGIVKLLCGAKFNLASLFGKEEYSDLDIKSVSLADDDALFNDVLLSLGDDGDLLLHLRKMFDCAQLAKAKNEKSSLSEAMVDVYDQHKSDLKWLKEFVKKYLPNEYGAIFLDAAEDNYAAYSYNVKSVKGTIKGKASQEKFSDFLRKKIQNVTVDDKDKAKYEEALERIKALTFLPKQKSTDNRVIPYQLYYSELKQLLENAEKYLPFLKEKDQDGLTVTEKILDIFKFRIPYYVGPLVSSQYSKNAWMVRKAEGKIYPWNFEEKVDLDESEQRFIDRMTNTCVYYPGEEVLPRNSLLYCEFTILNEINNIRIDGQPIPTEIKQQLFQKLFMEKAKVKVSEIRSIICQMIGKKDFALSGLDSTVKSSNKPYLNFRRLLAKGLLTKTDIENIIRRMAYTEDRGRIKEWLRKTYPQLPEEDVKYVAGLGLKDFGRLSKRFLTGLEGTDKQTGEVMTIMGFLRDRSVNLMQLLSDNYTFREQLDSIAQEYYVQNPVTLEDRLTEMRLSGAVKRSVYRTLEIVDDVYKATGRAPKKVFVEMARGSKESQKGKRTLSRKQQLLDLYKKVKNEDTRVLQKELEDMGEMADNRLQSDKLFLYYTQLGRCMYTGEPIDLAKLGDPTLYDIDHIYPQSAVKDDSILNNKVLVTSQANGTKGNTYPISEKIRHEMYGFWASLKEMQLISEEKFKRLTRSTHFTEEELMAFINRQLTETQQSTKAIATLLKERFGDATTVVYVKAGLVSDFRQEFDLVKSRAVNSLHHAKDAYLNIVVGNVYNMKFDRRWFDPKRDYSVKTKTVFSHPVIVNRGTENAWNGEEDLVRIKSVMAKNNIHLTRYSFIKHGGLFDQNPVKAGSGLVPLKAGVSTEKYGGYNKATAAEYLLVSYTIGKKRDVMFAPIELQFIDSVQAGGDTALEYVTNVISQYNGNKTVSDVKIELNGRPIKTQATISVDGMRLVLGAKTGSNLQVRPLTQLVVGKDWERYIKRLESASKKQLQNRKIQFDVEHDMICAEKNLELFDLLLKKLEASVFIHCPGNIAATLRAGKDAFQKRPLEEQVHALLNIIGWFNDVGGGCDLTLLDGAKSGGTKRPSMKLSGWAKDYSDVRIIDSSASGIFESPSENLLTLL